MLVQEKIVRDKLNHAKVIYELKKLKKDISNICKGDYSNG